MAESLGRIVGERPFHASYRVVLAGWVLHGNGRE